MTVLYHKRKHCIQYFKFVFLEIQNVRIRPVFPGLAICKSKMPAWNTDGKQLILYLSFSLTCLI